MRSKSARRRPAPRPALWRLCGRRRSARRVAAPDFDNMTMAPVHDMTHTDESRAFRQEYEDGKRKQDSKLDAIGKGVTQLKNLAIGIHEEMQKQDPMMEVIDDKVEQNTAELKKANKQLKTLLSELRSPQKMCVDLILVALLLGIGAYIFHMLKPQARGRGARRKGRRARGCSCGGAPAALPRRGTEPRCLAGYDIHHELCPQGGKQYKERRAELHLWPPQAAGPRVRARARNIMYKKRCRRSSSC